MSAEMNGQTRLDAADCGRELMDGWVSALSQVLESMTDQKPEVRWQGATGSFAEVGMPPDGGAEPEFLWWEQGLTAAPDALFWVGAQRATWEEAGTLTLRAAGLENLDITEARNTWFEILGQALPPTARAVSAVLGREVVCEAGLERAEAPDVKQWASVYLAFGGEPLPPLMVAFSPGLIALVSSPPTAAEPAPQEMAVTEAAPGFSARGSRTMELLLDIDLPVSISFGKTQLPMKDVLKLTTGSIVELNRGISEPVEVLVNHCLIARGEVVVVEGNYGVRIQEIANRQERLRSIR